MPVAKEEHPVEIALVRALTVVDAAQEAEDREAWLALKAQWLAAETAGVKAPSSIDRLVGALPRSTRA